jgi:hypothetical protein
LWWRAETILNMALSDFKTETSTEDQEIRSRKKIYNLELEREQWEEIFITYPSTIRTVMLEGSTSERKAVVQTIDEWVDGEGEFDDELTDDELEHLETVRDDVVEEYIED